MKYSTINSDYLKKLIQSTTWSDHQKIDELISLTNYIQHPPRTFNGGMHYSYLKSKYESDFLLLLKEFSEAKYQDELSKRKAETVSIKKLEKSVIRKDSALIKDWLKAGGRP